MSSRRTRTGATAPADYLGGDPVEARSIEGGRLDLDPSGLHFTGPAGADLRLPFDGLLGISISGRAAERRRRRGLRGTMRVAVLRGDGPAECEFAIDRSAATALRGQVDRELASRGRSPLPFVEELDGFPLRPRPANPVQDFEGSPHVAMTMAELGHRLASADARKGSSRRRRILPWILLGAALLAAEVIVPLLLVKGG